MTSLRRILSRLSSNSSSTDDISTLNPVISLTSITSLTSKEREERCEQIDRHLESVFQTSRLIVKEQKRAVKTDSVWLQNLESASNVCTCLLHDLLHERDIARLEYEQTAEKHIDTESALEF